MFKVLSVSMLLVFSLSAQAQKLVKIDGSSTVFPITEAVAEEFQIQEKGATKVTVGISGTGGGFKKFCRGETDVSNASRPITKKEMADCKTAGVKYMELPVAYDAIAIVVNPKNNWMKEVTLEELKKMWEPGAQGKITKWNQVNPKWPNQPLKLFGAGADSGTFDYFTEAVNGKSKASRGDFTASEDDNTLVMGVANDQYALGFIPLSYYEENKKKLKAVPVVNMQGKAVYPTTATVEDSTYNPLARPIFIYVSESANKRPEVKKFVEFYLDKAATLVSEVKYVALPKVAYDMAKERHSKLKLGTVFAGHSEVGLKIDELLKRETAL